MVGPNKILTVSYGTFSCTLEGFDDSFSTMKAIAEYFRDLASDDRYFGAEPPVPDADMLARIAEREIERRVDARIEGNEVMLRAADLEQIEAPAVDDAEAHDETQSAAPAETPDGKPLHKAKTKAKAAPKAKKDGSKAAKKAKAKAERKAAKKAAEAAEAAEAEADARALTAAATVAPAAMARMDDATPQDATPQGDADIMDMAELSDTPSSDDLTDMAALDAPIDAPVEAAPEATPDVSQTADAAPADDALSGDSVAAKLQRIRAMVSNETAKDADDTADYIEDQHADDTLNDLSGALDEFALDADTSEVDQTSDINAQFASDSDADISEPETDISSVLAQIAEDADASETAKTAAPADVKTEAKVTADVEAPQAEDGMDPAIAAALAASALPDDDAPEVEAEAAPEPIRARVIKVKRADFEKAVAEGQLEEIDDDEDDFADDPDLLDDDMHDAAEADSIPGRTSLSDDAEAELQAELAAVLKAEEQALAQVASEDPAPQIQTEAAAEMAQPEEMAEAEAPEAQPQQPAKSMDVDRLMDQADRELNAPETGRRQNAIAHLKAAVAATEAERRVTGNPQTDDTQTYRADLAEVVRPRRAQVQSSETRRPASVPPLKLVAEQRVDLDPADAPQATATAVPVTPVRPRRVAKSAPAAAPAADGGFAEFAENMGANELPDLLEAAAAYMSFVEGKPTFSRPQVMRAVAAAQGDAEFSREDGLRSFGQLLRQGKISKQKAGQFVVSEASRFNPQARYAGE